MAKKTQNLSKEEQDLMDSFLEKYITPKSPEEIILESLKKAVKNLSTYYITMPDGEFMNAQEIYERYMEGERSEQTEQLFKDALEIDIVRKYIEDATQGGVSRAKRRKLEGTG